MFSFFLKKPKIVLDCFTHVPDVEKLFPILHAEERLPPFWKNLPPTVKHNGPMRGTMKTCPGVGTLYRTGFILQSWEEIWLGTEGGLLKWFPEDSIEAHNSKQWGEDFLKNHFHAKLVSPWRIKEKTGVNFLYTNCFWHDDQFKPFVVNGVVDYKYQHTTSVNLLIPKVMYPKELTIPLNKELAHIIPLSESDIDIKMHTVSMDEYIKQVGQVAFTLNGQYFKRKKLLKDKGL
jgi:hypothetical protein